MALCKLPFFLSYRALIHTKHRFPSTSYYLIFRYYVQHDERGKKGTAVRRWDWRTSFRAFKRSSGLLGYYLSKCFLYAPDNNYNNHSGARCLHTLPHLFLTTHLEISVMTFTLWRRNRTTEKIIHNYICGLLSTIIMLRLFIYYPTPSSHPSYEESSAIIPSLIAETSHG